MNVFEKVQKKYLKALSQYVPIVARVHGSHHPEFFEVQKIFDTINGKIKQAGTNKPELDEEFIKLRQITDSYTVPSDVCETYEAVYHMLAEMDKAYYS